MAADLEFFIYNVSSDCGDWLAAFEGKELIFLGGYGAGKKQVEGDLAKFFETYYNFKVGKFVPAKWTKGNFWKTKHKIKLQGTEFQMKVWLELLNIPYGETTTYTDIAKKIKRPSAARAVGTAIGQNPICYWIPCHRVIGKNSNNFNYRWGSDTKKHLLITEGVFELK